MEACLSDIGRVLLLNRSVSSKGGSVGEALRATSSANWLGRCFLGTLLDALEAHIGSVDTCSIPSGGLTWVMPLHHCKPIGRKAFWFSPSPLPPGSWHPTRFQIFRLGIVLSKASFAILSVKSEGLPRTKKAFQNRKAFLKYGRPSLWSI